MKQERKLAKLERYFSLSQVPGVGVRCDESGLFVGKIALLERIPGGGGRAEWRPRSAADIDHDLTKLYGSYAEFSRNLGGLAAVARALNRNDLVHAQIATLLIGIPEPPLAGRPHETSWDLRDADDGPEEELVKFNPYHDERGRFTTADGAVAPGGENADTSEAGEVEPGHSGSRRPNLASQFPAHPQGVQRQSSPQALPKLPCLFRLAAMHSGHAFRSPRSNGQR